MVEDRMERKCCVMNQGDLIMEETISGVRAIIVARKCRNGHGVKCSRKVDEVNL